MGERGQVGERDREGLGNDLGLELNQGPQVNNLDAKSLQNNFGPKGANTLQNLN